MTQRSLFDTPPAVPSRAPAPMRPRLSRQCEQILERLRQGPATNYDLSRFALKYTSRLSEIRQAGYRVEVDHLDYETGVVTYVLREEASR
jgi:hypothetical protein